MAYLHPKEVCERHPTFLGNVFNMMDSEDSQMKTIAVETLGFLGLQADGKQVLEKHSM